MFKFNFDIEDDEQSVDIFSGNHTPRSYGSASAQLVIPDPFAELFLVDALDSLPSKISYSPITIPLVNGGEISLPRRDLFDARFQLISHNADDLDAPDRFTDAHTQSALQFLDAPSDLVPLIYEGGLKTWECSLDLASYLNSVVPRFDIHGKRMLEVGCGTSIPTLYILHRIFSSPPSPNQTHVHLQDYNASVLELVTIPNIILTWYLSEAAEMYRRSEEPSDAAVLELNISDNLKDAFQQSLVTYGVHLRFFSGSWDTFDLQKSGGSYNLVMTSETIYRVESIPSLVAIMRGACNAEGCTDVDNYNYLCLVAAKVLYFGVGGGVAEFVRCIRDQDSGTVETVWERTLGVERRVMSVRWK